MGVYVRVRVCLCMNGWMSMCVWEGVDWYQRCSLQALNYSQDLSDNTFTHMHPPLCIVITSHSNTHTQTLHHLRGLCISYILHGYYKGFKGLKQIMCTLNVAWFVIAQRWWWYKRR